MTETTHGQRWRELLADTVIREVIDGGSGARLIGYVANCIDDMARELERDPDGFDAERYAAECADHESGSLFPYTYDMAQAWAESIHHVTYESEAGPIDVRDLRGEMPDAFQLVCAQMEEITRRALELAAEKLREAAEA